MRETSPLCIESVTQQPRRCISHPDLVAIKDHAKSFGNSPVEVHLQEVHLYTNFQRNLAQGRAICQKLATLKREVHEWDSIEQVAMKNRKTTSRLSLLHAFRSCAWIYSILIKAMHWLEFLKLYPHANEGHVNLLSATACACEPTLLRVAPQSLNLGYHSWSVFISYIINSWLRNGSLPSIDCFLAQNKQLWSDRRFSKDVAHEEDAFP